MFEKSKSSGILRLFVLAITLSCVAASDTNVTIAYNATSNVWSWNVGSETWLQSPSSLTICSSGNTNAVLTTDGISTPANGQDNLGDWTGFSVTYNASLTRLVVTAQHYQTRSNGYVSAPSGVAVIRVSFPDGVDTSACGGGVADQSTHFPAFDTSAGLASTLAFLTWRGTTAPAVTTTGLKALAQKGLDAGPIVSYSADGTSLMWSTLTSHKIVVQTTVSGSASPISSLFSDSRKDQLACLSDLCFSDQKTDGQYVTQRIEGYGSTSAPSSGGLPLQFAWSDSLYDNFVGNTSSKLPDSSYDVMGDNGYIYSSSSDAPGLIPLIAFSKVYNSSHTDWAAVASSDGITWCTSNGYTQEYVIGYVLADPPSATGSVYSMGLSAAIRSIPADWSYSILFVATSGGPTAATYAWGSAIQQFSGTTRQSSVTLTDIGYYTDDGAYYYVWEAFGCCNETTHAPRPWAAEEGLVLVKEDLWNRGVPVAYLQLDDWWYSGKFYFGNVKVVEDWHPSNSSRLFPNGGGKLIDFQTRLGLPLQLYTPFWSEDKFDTEHKYNMTPSTVFSDTKLVAPNDSYRFFSDWFDLGADIVGSRKNFVAYEIDFLDSNFQGSISMFDDVDAANRFYDGMAYAAQERNLVIQYCLPSATDIMQSLKYSAVVQARASGDYVNEVDNALGLGGSSLLFGSLQIAPSKDTLWTSSPQPPTYSDTKTSQNYFEQPHVELDCVLATLSLGPVGISDGLGQVGVDLVSQAFMSPVDSTLLRPDRPLSWVDSYFFNTSGVGGSGAALDVRSTHSFVSSTRGNSNSAVPVITHYVVAWRTPTDATLGRTDLYPAPPTGAVLAQRTHILSPAGASQQSGCIDGQPAAGACVTFTQAPVIAATGTDLSNFSLTVISTPIQTEKGVVYFLGELNKFTHASSQRFEYVIVDTVNGGRAGLIAGVRGSAGTNITVTAIDALGVASVQTVLFPTSGFVDLAL
jgi:hypothetical protein